MSRPGVWRQRRCDLVPFWFLHILATFSRKWLVFNETNSVIVWYYRGFKISFFDLVVIEEVTKSSVFCKVQGDERSAGFGNAWSWVEKHCLWGLFQNDLYGLYMCISCISIYNAAQKKFSVQRERRKHPFSQKIQGLHVWSAHRCFPWWSHADREHRDH